MSFYMPPSDDELNILDERLQEEAAENINLFRTIFEGMMGGYEKFPDPHLATILAKTLNLCADLCAAYLKQTKPLYILAKRYKTENENLHHELEQMRTQLMKVKLGKE